jgi:DNA repair protein RecO (recombination protein O)
VLGVSALGDADLIVSLLAERSGRVRGVAGSARKSRRRFGGTLEPMTCVRARWRELPGRELHRLESLELRRSFARMQSDPLVQAACAVMAETGLLAVKEEQEEPAVFRLYGAVLDAMDGGLDPWCAIRYFEYWTLRLHGVLADWSACAWCGRVLPVGGSILAIPPEGPACRHCARDRGSGVRLGTTEREALALLGQAPPQAVAGIRELCIPGATMARFLKTSLERFVERQPRAYRHMEGLA